MQNEVRVETFYMISQKASRTDLNSACPIKKYVSFCARDISISLGQFSIRRKKLAAIFHSAEQPKNEEISFCRLPREENGARLHKPALGIPLDTHARQIA